MWEVTVNWIQTHNLGDARTALNDGNGEIFGFLQNLCKFAIHKISKKIITFHITDFLMLTVRPLHNSICLIVKDKRPH